MKIAICVPHCGDTKAEFTISLVRLAITTLEAKINFNGAIVRPEIKPFFFTTSILPLGRIKLAEAALEWGADYLLWADSDHSFPGSALLRLLAHNVDVVGINQPRVRPPHELTAVGLDGAPLRPGSGLESVMSMGLALCLVRAAVFSSLSRPWFQVNILENGDVIGEDFWFFRRLREAGVKLHVDHDLSARVGHVGQRIYKVEDARDDASGAGPAT
jgi:hypothetical protein